MTIKLCSKWWLRCFALMLAASSLRAQEPAGSSAGPAANSEVLMARALRAYQSGDYPAALQQFGDVIKAFPSYRPALFWRALVYGEMAAQHQRQSWLVPQGSAQRATAIRQYREEYQQMAADLDRLMAQVSDKDSIIRLLDAVTSLKLAGPPPPPPTSTAPDEAERRADPTEAATLLDRAVKTLQSYLRPEAGMSAPAGLNRVRAELFLGIAHYRRALLIAAGRPAATGAGSPEEVKHLQEAKDAFARLADDKSDSRVELLLPGGQAEQASERARWLSYAHFYLGQVNVELANRSTGQRAAYRGHLQDASTSYGEARKQNALVAPALRSLAIDETADLMIGKPDVGGGAIGDALAQATEVAGGPYQDFRIDWRSGFMYDTNVPLLGGNTALPYQLGKKEDFRYQNGLILSYTGTLAALTGIQDEQLDRWELGLAGRMINGWHASIHEYNEQDYGASVALQYRLVDQSTSGHKHGPVYLGVQYDYDYFLLGNDGFLRMNRVTPRLTIYTFDRHSITTLAFSYEDRNYLDRLFNQEFDRDGNYYYVNLTQAFELVDMTKFYADHGIKPWGLGNDPDENDPYEYTRYLKPYFGFEYGWDKTQGSEFENERFMVVGGVNAPLPWGLLFDFRGQWEWQDYKGFRGGSLVDYHRRAREDFIQRYGFGLERSFVLVPGSLENRGTLKMDRVVLTIRGDIYFVDDDSNVVDRLKQAVFSYDRAIYGLSFTLSFN